MCFLKAGYEPMPVCVFVLNVTEFRKREEDTVNKCVSLCMLILDHYCSALGAVPYRGGGVIMSRILGAGVIRRKHCTARRRTGLHPPVGAIDCLV